GVGARRGARRGDRGGRTRASGSPARDDGSSRTSGPPAASGLRRLPPCARSRSSAIARRRSRSLRTSLRPSIRCPSPRRLHGIPSDASRNIHAMEEPPPGAHTASRTRLERGTERRRGAGRWSRSCNPRRPARRSDPMRHNVNILAADIGGTHARFAHLRLEDGILRSLGQITYRSAEIVSARDVVRRFLAESGAESDTAALAVAGPVTRGRGRLTNLGLEFDQRELAGWLGLGHATVLNDFEALGFVLPLLDPEDFIVLHHGDPDAHGVMALLGAGTGLGQALVRRSRADGVVEVAPTEGGHSSFAARNETEWALQRFLAARYDGHVSWERVVSGPGLAAI